MIISKEGVIMNIIEIEGIGEKYAKDLKKAGITKIEQLEDMDSDGLDEVAEKSGVSRKLIDKWAEHADLMEIWGVGPEYAEALNEIGIDSVKELKMRNPENTLEKIKELDKEKPDVIRKLPSLDQIADWIEQAKGTVKLDETDLIEIEGIGEKYDKALAKEGVKTTADLIKMEEKEMDALAEKTGISRKLIDKWQEHADLMRVKGIGPEYAEALNEIGIDSVAELKMRNPANTLEKIKELDKEKPDVIRRLPTEKRITDWIDQAKDMKKYIND